ncbi:MAG: efflux RND transporter periplasmic adaptor subunit [Devosia sp.]
MKHLFRWIVVLLVLGGAAYGAYAMLQPAAVAETPRTVPVTRGNIERTVLASGVIEASALISVGAEVSGIVKMLNVGLGDDVKAGQLIAELDSLNQENAMKVAEASLAAVEAQRGLQDATLAKAQAGLARSNQLQSQQLVSDADLQAAQLAVSTAEAQIKSIEAQIQQAQLAVDAAELNLSRTKIIAPMDGTIVSLEVGVGQSVNANNASPTIVKIANLQNMVVKAEISEADVPRVRPGQKVYFTILGAPNRPFEAQLRAIEPAPESIADNAVASSSSSGAVYYNGLFDVANPDRLLRISMTAQVTIVLESAEGVLTVPATALARRGRNDVSLQIWNAATGRAESRPVKVGINNNVVAEITSGLAEGDLVVVPRGTVPTGSTETGSPGGNRGLFGGGGGAVFIGGGPPPGGG